MSNRPLWLALALLGALAAESGCRSAESNDAALYGESVSSARRKLLGKKPEISGSKEVGLKEYSPPRGIRSPVGEVLHVDLDVSCEARVILAPDGTYDPNHVAPIVKDGWQIDREATRERGDLVQHAVKYRKVNGVWDLRLEFYCFDGRYVGIHREEMTHNGRYVFRKGRAFTRDGLGKFVKPQEPGPFDCVETLETIDWEKDFANVRVRQRKCRISRTGAITESLPWREWTYIVLGVYISMEEKRSCHTPIYVETSRPYLGLLDRRTRGVSTWPEEKQGEMTKIVRLIHPWDRPLHIGLHFSCRNAPSEISVYEHYRFTREDIKKHWPRDPTPPLSKDRLIKTIKVLFEEALRNGLRLKYELDDTDTPKGDWVIRRW
ncbi:MAG: hypothetical protein ACYS47_02845 [Planctomycetota bacterium]|jgi:hypothetical protein